MTKNICCTPYLSKHTSFDRLFCCMSFKWWHLQMLFSFCQNFGFLEKGWKRGKNDPNDKKMSLSVSQELCLIWLWFLVHMCKISGNFFFHFFKILVFRIFQNSTLSVKKKLRSVSHLHMCVIFFCSPWMHSHAHVHAACPIADFSNMTVCNAFCRVSDVPWPSTLIFAEFSRDFNTSSWKKNYDYRNSWNLIKTIIIVIFSITSDQLLPITTTWLAAFNQNRLRLNITMDIAYEI